MNQNYQFDPNMMDQNMMPGNGNYLPTPGNLNLYGPYEGFMRGNLFQNLYDPYENYRPARLIPNDEREELLLNISQMAFAAHELNLYLDVFPNDRNALTQFNRYRRMANEAMNIYENKYGPLTLTSDTLETYPWAWESKQWPWEKEDQ